MTDNSLDSTGREKRIDGLLENVGSSLLDLYDFLMKKAQLRTYTKTASGHKESLATLGEILPVDLAVSGDRLKDLRDNEEWEKKLQGQGGEAQMISTVLFRQNLPKDAAPLTPVYRIDVPQEKVAYFDNIYSVTFTYSEELLATGITIRKFYFNVLRSPNPGYTITFTCQKNESPYRLIDCFVSRIGTSVMIFFNEGIINSRIGDDETNLEFTDMLLKNLSNIFVGGTFARVQDLYDLRHKNDSEV